MKLDKDRLAAIRERVKKALPKGWRARVHRYLDGVRCNIYAAPVDILSDLKDHGMNLDGSMHVELTSYMVNNFSMPSTAFVLQLVYDALYEDPFVDYPTPYSVTLCIGTKEEPFLHIVKPPKKLHPKVAAYAEHAKKWAGDNKVMLDYAVKIGEHNDKMFPNKSALKNAHHTWA